MFSGLIIELVEVEMLLIVRDGEVVRIWECLYFVGDDDSGVVRRSKT